MWSTQHVLDLCARALIAREDLLRREQAVYGLDALDELKIHEILAAAITTEGLGVLREQPFPGKPGSRAKRSARERCDLVLTHKPGVVLRDPVAATLERDALVGSLFESTALPPTPGVDPAEAFWLEVKAVGQFCFRAGVPTPNSAYSSEITAAIRDDLLKLSREIEHQDNEVTQQPTRGTRSSASAMTHAGLLLVLFTADEATATHDRVAAMHRAIDLGARLREHASATLPILDRIGNVCCSLTLLRA
ncbi:MAG: hypothetical protein AB7Q00_06435 [Phycisphaerales bacterium]